jgi:uncharacterized protein (DUF1330 family)
MQVLNAVNPSPAQIQALVASAVPGPIVMLNLLKFRPNAAYDDGHDAHISGQEAYMRYGAPMQQLVAADGGRIIFSGQAQTMVIGEVGEQWDAVALLEYKSPQDFVRLATSEAVNKIAVHRKAGLTGQLLIMCTSAMGA